MKRKADVISSKNCKDVTSNDQMQRSKTGSNCARPTVATKHQGSATDYNPRFTSPSPIERSIFKVHPLDRFDNVFPFFRKPSEIGGFSCDENRRFLNNKNNLREYKPAGSAELDYDLRVGYQNFQARDETVPERLDHLLQWVVLHPERFRLSDDRLPQAAMKSLNTDFITWRGGLVKIMCTPYETREGWRMDACRHNGTIFINEVETEATKERKRSETRRQKEMCYWGYKFEDYMTKPFGVADEHSKPRVGINNSEAFCSVIRTRLSQHSIVMGAEVDCCQPINGEVKAPDCYIELKTSRIMHHIKQRRNFARFKLKKFWAQSFLAGVPRVICGMRDDDGIVREIETFETLQIPEIANTNSGEWKAAVCVNFLDSCLQWMKEVLSADEDGIVHTFRFDEPFKVVTVKRQAKGVDVFLPKWFLANSDEIE